MASILKSRRGNIQTATNAIMDVFLVMAILTVGFLALNNATSGEIVAENNVRNLGSLVDVASMSSRDIVIREECVGDTVFIINKNRIVANEPSFFGGGSAVYHYAYAEGMVLPEDVELDCTEIDEIIIKKIIDQSDGTSTIEIRGNSE